MVPWVVGRSSPSRAWRVAASWLEIHTPGWVCSLAPTPSTLASPGVACQASSGAAGMAVRVISPLLLSAPAAWMGFVVVPPVVPVVWVRFAQVVGSICLLPEMMWMAAALVAHCRDSCWREVMAVRSNTAVPAAMRVRMPAQARARVVPVATLRHTSDRMAVGFIVCRPWCRCWGSDCATRGR